MIGGRSWTSWTLCFIHSKQVDPKPPDLPALFRNSLKWKWENWSICLTCLSQSCGAHGRGNSEIWNQIKLWTSLAWLRASCAWWHAKAIPMKSWVNLLALLSRRKSGNPNISFDSCPTPRLDCWIYGHCRSRHILSAVNQKKRLIISSSHLVIIFHTFPHGLREGYRQLRLVSESSLQMLLYRSWPQHEDNIIFIILDPWMEVNKYAGNWQNHDKIILFGRLWICQVSR